MANFYAQLRPR